MVAAYRHYPARLGREVLDEAKLAFPAGGTPNCQRTSSRSCSQPPVADVERRIREDVVGLGIGHLVGVEGVARLDSSLDAADGEVHLAQPPEGNERVGRKVGPLRLLGRLAGGVLGRGSVLSDQGAWIGRSPTLASSALASRS